MVASAPSAELLGGAELRGRDLRVALHHHCDGFSQTRSALPPPPPPPYPPTPPARAKPWAPLDWAPGPRARWRQGPWPRTRAWESPPQPPNHPSFGLFLAEEPSGDLQDTFT